MQMNYNYKFQKYLNKYMSNNNNEIYKQKIIYYGGMIDNILKFSHDGKVWKSNETFDFYHDGKVWKSNKTLVFHHDGTKWIDENNTAVELIDSIGNDLISVKGLDTTASGSDKEKVIYVNGEKYLLYGSSSNFPSNKYGDPKISLILKKS